MKLLVICDTRIPVPPKGYGGTERIAWEFVRIAESQGHEIWFRGNQRSSIERRKFLRKNFSKNKLVRFYAFISYLVDLKKASAKVEGFVNFGRSDWYARYLKINPGMPSLVRFGNPIHQVDVDRLTQLKNPNLVLVSLTDQQRSHVLGGSWRTIHNGINLKEFEFCEKPEDYCLYLGRLSPSKGVAIAIRAAKLAGKKIILAGNLPEQESGAIEYFKQEIEPWLGEDVIWVGEVSGHRKTELLQKAETLIFPNVAGEAFGLVMIEALACGVPVVASRRGPALEIVKHGKTGYLGDTIRDLADCILKSSNIHRLDCRKEVEENFSSDRMVSSYLDVCEKLLGSKART